MKICDFGISKEINLELVQAHTLDGTVAYFSPLLRRAKLEVDVSGEKKRVQHNVFKSDVYSLGITLLHMMLLDLPKSLANLRNLQQNIDTLLSRPTNYSPALVELVKRMLVVDESLRPDFLQLDAEINHPLPYADDQLIPQVAQLAADMPKEELKFEAKCGFSQVRVCATLQEEVPCMVQVKAPQTDPDTLERRRTGVDFVCVIDISGSMAGSRIRLVKETLNNLVQLLKEIDRVSIVTFNDEAQRVCPLIICSPEGKERLQREITNLTASGRTKLIAGFQIGVDIVLQRRYRNQAITLFLFSDGGDTSGRDARAECLTALQTAKSDPTLTVHTFGYGGDIDEYLMTAVATEGKGMLHAINSENGMSDAFAFTLGSTTSVVAKDIEIRLKLKEGEVPCKISKLYTKEPNCDYFSLPEITANQTKDFIFMLKPDAMPLSASTKFAAVTALIKYKESDGTLSQQSLKFPIKFVPWSIQQPIRDSAVLINWNRVMGADCLRDAKNLVDQGRFEDAYKKLYSASELLEASEVRTHPIVDAVIGDIRETIKFVQDKTSWNPAVAAHLAAVTYSHQTQSATTGSSQYASPQQQNYRIQFPSHPPVPEEPQSSNRQDTL